MPFHGLASKVVLAGLQGGQQDGVFVGTVQGRVDASSLLTSHRRAVCDSWADDPWRRFLHSAGDPREASEEAMFQEGLLRELLARRILRTDIRRPAEHGYRESKVIADVPSNTPSRHPLWHFEVYQLRRLQVILCCAVLFFAGILCAAGGIGGGGIYVTVLMVAGGLSIVDAVPLSKTVVFLGSVPSLILNFKKSMSSGAKALIDFNICRLVVPCSLMGTFLGVFLNRVLPGWVVLLALSLILICMTAMVTRTTVEQYMEEQIEAKEHSAVELAAEGEGDLKGRSTPRTPKDSARSTGSASGYRRRRPAGPPLPGVGAAGVAGAGSPLTGAEVAVAEPAAPQDSKSRSSATRKDVYTSLVLILVVVLSSVFRYHAGQCKDAHTSLIVDEACHHPFAQLLGHNTLKVWMHHEGTAEALMAFFIVFPCCVCCIVALYYSIDLIRFEGWDSYSVLCYDVMSIVTGCLAGLVGIGGGLIFSPFFLMMGVDPGIAVATSSTCVIFTASSTSLQYLLTDRVIISLSLVYGIVNIVASYMGTTFVHLLMDDFCTRRSYISAIVGLGVLISAVLSLVKLGMTAGGVEAAH